MNVNKALNFLNLKYKYPLSEEDIKKSFRQQAKVCHPDSPDGSTEKMQELNEAKEYMIDNLDEINRKNNPDNQNKYKAKPKNKIIELTDEFVLKYLSANTIGLKKIYITEYVKNANKVLSTKNEDDFLKDLFEDIINNNRNYM